jgi:hypothetical protein
MASAHTTLATAVCSPEFGVEREHEHVQGLHSYILSMYLVVSTAVAAAVQLRVRVVRTASMPPPLPRQSGCCPSYLGATNVPTLQHSHLDDPFRLLLSACLGSLAGISGRTTVRRLKRFSQGLSHVSHHD